MDCGDANHILLSKHTAEDLEHYAHWKPWLHDIGEVEVNHAIRVRNDAAAYLALVYARTGETDEAINVIEKLLTLPGNYGEWTVTLITVADLKWRWPGIRSGPIRVSGKLSPDRNRRCTRRFMAADIEAESQLEIAHVLYTDIVGY